MKIIFVIGDLYSGGAQRQMVNLALEYINEGHEVSTLTYYSREYYGELLRENGVKTICIEEKNPILRIIKFRKYLRRNNFDIVISYLGISNFLCELAALPNKKWKLIANERSANPIILKSLKSKIIRMFHYLADEIVTNSHANKDIILKVTPFLSGKKISVIYNVIDLGEWKPDENFEFKKDDKLNLTIAASHRYLKNAKILVEALTLLTVEERNRLVVNWYGNSLVEPYYDNSIIELRKSIIDNDLINNFNLYPATLEINSIMKESDIVGLFSFFEGLPNAICEGMSLGKPILASAVSDVPLLVENDINGFVFNPNDANELSLYLSKLINMDSNQLKKMGNKSREKALKVFNSEEIMAKNKQLLK